MRIDIKVEFRDVEASSHHEAKVKAFAEMQTGPRTLFFQALLAGLHVREWPEFEAKTRTYRETNGSYTVCIP